MTHKLNSRDEGEFIALYVTLGLIKPPATILILSHVVGENHRHDEHFKLCRRIAKCRVYTPTPFSRIIRIESDRLTALVEKYVERSIAHDKRFTPAVWDLDDESLYWIAEGLLNETIRKGSKEKFADIEFCRDMAIVPDLERICARLGYKLDLTAASTDYGITRYDSFVGKLKRLD